MTRSRRRSVNASACWAAPRPTSALAASLFDTVRPVGPVGGDFAESEFEVLRTRGTLTDDVQVIPDGKTFFWAGEYGWDLNTRETLDTQLGVFGEFEPQLSEAARDCDVLFLANIQPTLQASVLDQCHNPRWTATGFDELLDRLRARGPDQGDRARRLRRPERRRRSAS